MTTSNFQLALNAISNLTTAELVELNRSICAAVRQQNRVKAVSNTAKFTVGQIVRFHKPGRGRNAGTHYIKISGYNRAGTCVVGYPVRPESGDLIPGGLKWTVAPSYCTLVNG